MDISTILKKAKKLTKADKVVVVMSGNFVQRGAPALLPKHLRAKMALKSGADLVIELPVFYACASAEYFAYGAVSLLHALRCVDSICFGSECGDLTLCKKRQILWRRNQTHTSIAFSPTLGMAIVSRLHVKKPFRISRKKKGLLLF